MIYEGTITEDVYKMSKSGMLKPKVSVGVDWLKPGGGLIVGEQGQVIPYAFDFSEFSLLMNMEPGDPDTNLQIWDGLMEGIIREGIEIVESVEARKRAFALEDARVRNEKLAKELALENSKETSNPFTTEVMLDPIDRLRLLVTSR